MINKEVMLLKIAASIFIVGVVGYLIAWYWQYVLADMSAFFLILTLITLIFWLLDRFRYYPTRKAKAQELKAGANYLAQDKKQRKQQVANIMERDWYLEWTAGIFPIIFVVFVVRSFFYEPFIIPSGSMLPTLQIKDLILVDKNVYGIKLPLVETKLTQGKPVQRGDIVVFHSVSGDNISLIKRVVGLPGDKVSYYGKVLAINDQPVATHPAPDTEIFDNVDNDIKQKFVQQLGAAKYNIYTASKYPTIGYPTHEGAQFEHYEQCEFDYPKGFTCVVPAGHYFAMGDNRDKSDDSRYWGFIPAENIVGKAVYVWLNLTDWKRRGGLTDTAA